MSELSRFDQLRHKIPPGGQWFSGVGSQAPVLEIYHDKAGLAVAWDGHPGGKMFGIYHQSKEEFMHLLLDAPTSYRNCYELLVENIPCKGYADVEWEGPPEPEHDTLKRLVAAIRSKVQTEYSHEPKIYVCCGTRPVNNKRDGIHKHSYHIVLGNIIFECNHDKTMKNFFAGISDFTWKDNKPMIDDKVYTKNRHFRLPHCTKAGSIVPLLRISGDPLLDEFGHDWGRDVQAVLPFFISQPDITEDCKFIKTQPQLHQPQDKKKNIKRARIADEDVNPVAITAASQVQHKLFPVPTTVIQQMLVTAGDSVSILGAIQYLPEEDKWKIQCDQRGQGRKCLLDPDTTHSSNNALLFIDRFEAGFRVKYQCMSTGCASCAKPTLGYISFHLETLEWKLALSSPVQDDITQDHELMEEEPDEMQEDHASTALGTPPVNDDDHGMQDTQPRVEKQVKMVEPPDDPDNPDLNTYEMVKARFELQCFKVQEPFCYIRVKKDHTPYQLSHVELQQYYCDWTYWGPNKDGEIVKTPFITYWLHKDFFKRTVDGIVVDPTNTLPNVYNMWRGFDAEKLAPVPPERVEELIQPIIRHFNDVVTNGVPEHTEYIQHYLANMLQRPCQKTQVAMSLYGAQGCGKGIIFEFFRHKILGTHCSYQTSNPENDLFGRFANGAVNRVCIQIDEVKSLHDHVDRLKDFITGPTLNYEKKCKDTIVVSNLSNLILTSNNANALTVSTDDRRFVLFHCSSVHKGDAQYFQQLGEQLKRPEVARAYYQYLMSLDLSQYPESFQHKRPITEYYKESQQNSIPVIYRFFSALVNWKCDEADTPSSTDTPEKGRTPAREMYKRYEQFHSAGNYKFLMTETSFGRETRKISGVTVKKAKSCNFYILDYKMIKKYLQDNNGHDEDATIH